VERFRFLAEGTGRTRAQAALKFCLAHPAVSVVIPGIKTPEQAAAVARHADAAVVGSAIVDRVKAGLDDKGKARPDLVPGVFSYIKTLADGVRSVRKV
jgi:aryl-alcohol dehydrogenase-like predicted oxidoreductase